MTRLLAALLVWLVIPIPVATAQDEQRILVAGDIASCRWTADSATARLVAGRRGIVMTAGDHAYQVGSAAELRACYHPTWGRFKARTRPVPGNHDYATPGARGYFDYFGRQAGPIGRGYYAFDVGTSWRVYALDSNRCVGGGCGRGGPQHRWLAADLAAEHRACVMAVLHHPHFSSGQHGNADVTRPLIRLLYDAGAEVIVNGHDHVYERFAPARPWGRIDRRHGIRQFIVGTGGAPLYGWKPGRPDHSRRRQNQVHGVLELELETTGYEWRFLPVRGGFRDTGSGSCHEAPTRPEA